MDVLPYLGPLLTIVPAVLAAYGNGPVIAVVVFARSSCTRNSKAASWCRSCTAARCGCRQRSCFSPHRRRGSGRHHRRPAGAAAGRGDCDVDRPTARGSPGRNEQPRDAETRRKDEQQEQEYEQRTEQKPAAKPRRSRWKSPTNENRGKQAKTTRVGRRRSGPVATRLRPIPPGYRSDRPPPPDSSRQRTGVRSGSGDQFRSLDRMFRQ